MCTPRERGTHVGGEHVYPSGGGEKTCTPIGGGEMCAPGEVCVLLGWGEKT